ncbi:DNA polymerase beta [Paraphaeosphaeria sporulosa]|uniref:DNA-directed DNA polymerase n=1 Tax=Paraphaeosphaeria sporulosa TaxID=1460663 RepID=A0A177BXP7_9PLEO|nr:DNA polymerase beta [Paraphaeosphaeria sporulosa]OAF99287.1 DNA polymerase beta [Paraphaeosphaeria sporulosa]
MEARVPNLGSFSSNEGHLTVTGLDLSSIPPIGTLSAHFKGDEEDKVKATLRRHGAQLTADVSKVKILIGKVGARRRAEFELRSRKFEVEEVKIAVEKKRSASPEQQNTPRKRARVSCATSKPIIIHNEGSTTEEEAGEGSETEDEGPARTRDTPMTSPVIPDEHPAALPPIFNNVSSDDTLWVIKVDWLDECLSAGRLVPLGANLVYMCKIKKRPPAPLDTGYTSIKANFTGPPKSTSQTHLVTRRRAAPHILDRAKEDATTTTPKRRYNHQNNDGHGSRRFEGKSYASSATKPTFANRTAQLLQQTTSDYESEDSDLPPPPDWVVNGVKYACQRFTPANPPNQDFIEQLKKIRTARTLIDDAIGVRAYSSIIASIAAYPHKLRHPRELARLPSCDEKTAALFVEWKNTGKIQAVEDYENDEAMKVLRAFYDIWGVGAKTARNFYYNKGWLDLDDIIEYGWNELDRVQQIGVKFYDEFLSGIPRAEVESIASVVRQHAVRLRDSRISVTIVGGYRRGKPASGDVDMIVSHPDLAATAHLVRDIVTSLETDEWITHTLTLSLHNTSRGQTTLPFRATKTSAGAGFDTLDKALVVWQDPVWPTRAADLATNPRAKNPNIHRRVDIIVAPWRTVGCAVMGWSGGTTFQRDLRRYAKYKRGWKFDSSGVRSRETGEVVMLEGEEGVSGTAEEAERRVFEGLGLEWVPPEMRCTN